MNQRIMARAGTYQKYWEQCWDPKVCLKIPFDGQRCIGAHVCVRILEDNGYFYLEGELNGQTARYCLADACIPTFSVGIATLEICVTGLNVQNNQLKSLHLEVRACVGADIAGNHLGQCWTLLGRDIVFSKLSSKQLADLIGVAADHKSAEWADYGFMISSTDVQGTVGCTCV